MSKVKNEGLEVVRMQHMAVADHNGDLRWMTARFVADCELYAMPDFGRAPDLCRRSEALAGYAERDAWIAAQDVQIKALQSGENSWQSGYDEGRRMGGKHCMLTVDQLRAELAALNAKLDASKFCANVADDLRAELDAAKETIMRYETTAENCDVLRALLATPAPIPDALQASAMVVPDGYKLVPIMLTPEMITVDPYGMGYGRLHAAWSRLLAASPAPGGGQ